MPHLQARLQAAWFRGCMALMPAAPCAAEIASWSPSIVQVQTTQDRLEQSTPLLPCLGSRSKLAAEPCGPCATLSNPFGGTIALGGTQHRPHLVPQRSRGIHRSGAALLAPCGPAALATIQGRPLTSMSAASAAALAAAEQQLAAGRPAACLAVLAALAPDQREALLARRLQALCHIQLAGDADCAASTSSSWWKVS